MMLFQTYFHPLMAESLFLPFHIIGFTVGILLAILIFKQSKKRNYTQLLWQNIFNILGLFGTLLLIYICLFYLIPSPSFLIIIMEAIIYCLLYISMTVFVILFILLAPPRLGAAAQTALHRLFGDR
jgi:hypothetical protein